MNSNTKGWLFVGLGILSMLWFAYEALGYVTRGGVLPGENPALEYGLTGLKFVMMISFFVSAINAFKQKG